MSFINTIIIDNVCGWPNLTMMPDGALITTVFNQPVHGTAEGEAECYISHDNGTTWTYHSTPVGHEQHENRMNVACGITRSRDLIVIVGGWDRRPKLGKPAPPWHECNRLPAKICRSSDGGKTFAVSDFVYQIPDDPHVLVPYGDVFCVGERLACACYTVTKDMMRTRSYIVYSEDDGQTWTSHGVISLDNHHETALLFFDGHNGIALARENATNHLDQYITEDDGYTWQYDISVTGPGVHPGHLLRLMDDSVLLTVGVRYANAFGIGACISHDRCKTWGRLNVIASFPHATDGGYPSTVQLADGRLLTHYYANKGPLHDRYFVGQVMWETHNLW